MNSPMKPMLFDSLSDSYTGQRAALSRPHKLIPLIKKQSQNKQGNHHDKPYSRTITHYWNNLRFMSGMTEFTGQRNREAIETIKLTL